MQDWSRKKILNELKIRNLTLSSLSRDNGMNNSTLNNVLERSWPKAEKIVAYAIGIQPSDIWPSRYGQSKITDWHHADIIAALKKKGITLTELSRSLGMASQSGRNVLYRRWPKMQNAIAETIGKKPQEIWPSRYR